MKILLSYSREHFDPALPRGEQRHLGTSANILASSLYDVLGRLGDVTYIDPTEHGSVAGQQFDLFVGQVRNFRQILQQCTVRRSVYFAVNMHPAARTAILRGAVRSEGLSVDSLASEDLVDVLEYERAIEAADYVVGVGNVAVLNSYLDNGVAPAKIKMLNYGVGPALPTSSEGVQSNRILYSASRIGLRKGYDIVDGLIRTLVDSGADLHLDVVGTPASEHYRLKLEQLVAAHPARVRYHGWVDAKSQQYQQILQRNAFVLAPALEEGQAGAVLDALRAGLVPIVSHGTGIDFSPLGVLEPRVQSEVNQQILSRAIALPADELQRLREKSLDYYREFHEDFLPVLAETIERCLTDHLHPKVSVTLPIFNKEATILPLLEHLDAAAAAYGNVELHVIFDGCEDRTEQKVRDFFQEGRGYPVTFEVTPNLFEVKTNNIGLKQSTGKYCLILQDDNFLYDSHILFEATSFLDKTARAAILGCLAGVNFYPRGHRVAGPGQIAMTDNETYWRQDAATDPALATKFFQVDACMRGPLVVRRDFLEDHGYLDEVYAPLYMDDMDLGFRAAAHGHKVYAMLGKVENKSLTMAHYGAAKKAFFDEVIARNTEIFYSRWSPGTDKDYTRVERVPISGGQVGSKARRGLSFGRLATLTRLAKAVRYALRLLDQHYCRDLSDAQWKSRMAWVRQQAAQVPEGATVLDIGAGSAPYRESFSHTRYVTQDLMETPDLQYGGIDIVSDIAAIPLPDGYADVILCTEVFEHVPEPLRALREIERLLKPGGRLIFTAPLGSGHHQSPYHFYGGYTRFWYEKFFPEHGLEIRSLQPNGGLFAHTIEMLWRSRDRLVNSLLDAGGARRAAAYAVQLLVYNLPTLVLNKCEQRWLIEDFTVCFLCVAEKSGSSLDAVGEAAPHAVRA